MKEQHLKICTINLFNYVAPPDAFYDFANIYTQDEWALKTQWLTRTIANIDPDVIGFQEVFSIDALKSTLANLGFPHFSTVDEPDIEQDYICSNPVVAIASRYPILNTNPINTRSAIAKQYPGFEFSRQPIHAVIDVPRLGPTDMYVVHFKSQRPTQLAVEVKTESVSNADLSTGNVVEEEPDLKDKWLAENQGKWLSTIQRGMEAHVLHQHIIETKQHDQRPCVVMGDFNQSLESNEFHCLTSKHLFRHENSRDELSAWHLHNSRELSVEQRETVKKPTYYVGAQGKELDYILLSSEFSSYSSHTHAVVNHYDVEDSHLVNPRFGIDHVSSDHGIVIVDISII
ncbi:endonuclease/exonuclease/phosphatase family protein [uncultured Vibrio sp.]|uniref:endonuclease/exonuclease/phosphatase family protein n=1 Tax=uncultured Vibrio sp. TaxID=114054 RepID=UPI0025F782E8|nr:endonuclease/exonuclease/phosphatase family protein [uncultured Vibrio sp.]